MDDFIIVTEDGSLDLGDSIEKIVFHQNLNVFLVITKDNTVRVFDPNSSTKLADVPLANYVTDPGGTIQCMYHDGTGDIVLCGGKSIGIRQHHQGVLLLDTILQTQVTSQEDVITLEILHSEALQLQQVLWEVNSVGNANDVKEALAQAIADPELQSCTSPKLGKWRTICLTLPLSTLRSVCSSLVRELRQLTYFIPALSLASALCHRLHHLSPTIPAEETELVDKESMFSETARLSTFAKWPHMNYKWALPEQMAQAGFFHQPVASDDDRAMCFICNVCLVYWEPTDEPWSEHERHSPNCPYVKGEHTHNVPLSITNATCPALTHNDRADKIHKISVSNSSTFLATSTAFGSITIWNIDKQVKKEISFLVDPSHPTILDKHFEDTIGYTDTPLRPFLLKDAWAVPAEEISLTSNLTKSSSSSKNLQESQKQSSSNGCETKLFPEGSKGQVRSPKRSFHDIPAFEADDSDDDPATFYEKYLQDIPKGPHNMQPNVEISDMEITLEEVLQLDNLDNDPFKPLPFKPLITLPKDHPSEKLVTIKCSTKSVSSFFQGISGELFAPMRQLHDVRVSSLCIFTDPFVRLPLSGNSKKGQNSCLAIGVGLRRYDLFNNSFEGIVQVRNNFNQSTGKREKVLDIMDLETPDSKDDLSSFISDTNEFDQSKENNGSSSRSNINNENVCNSSDSDDLNNFVPYLLIYDLCPLVQAQNVNVKPSTKAVHQGSSKKSTRKAIPSNSLVKIKGDVDTPYENLCVNEDLCMEFVPGKYKSSYKNETTSITSDKSTPKTVPQCIQCIPLPHHLNELKLQLFVDKILITPCGRYLLLSLLQYNNVKKPRLDDSFDDFLDFDSTNVAGGYLLYKIISFKGSPSVLRDHVNSNLFLNKNMVAKEIAMIPDLVYSEEEGTPVYMAGVICMDGCLRMLSLSSLEYVQDIKPTDKKKFNNITYCPSLERLCVTREDGKVLLMQVKGQEDLSDDAELVRGDSAASSDRADAPDKDIDAEGNDLLVNSSLAEETLDKCVELTQFQPGCPKFVVTVPPCWSEVIQAQKKRRNPQHLQHQSEEIDSARTWRLERDRTTIDEHLFDILLPHSCGGGFPGSLQIGHIDVKLNFVVGTTQSLPVMQITLLKQNLKSARKVFPRVIDDYLEYPKNPAVTREFLSAHKAEIICGPVTINQFIDLSGQAANITLTSPDLYACKGRSFLIHIKAIKQDKNEDNKNCKTNCDLDLLTQYVPPQSATFFDKLSSSSANLKRGGESPKGCNVIQDLTLTIHCCTKTSIPNERLQRLSMIENEKFHANLIAGIVNPSSSQHVQHRAFDILLWILSIHIASEHNPTRREHLVSLIQKNLNLFIRSCILHGDRSLAHKMTKILLTVLESFSTADQRKNFGICILSSLLEYLEGIVKSKSAGAVYWYFSLLNHVKWCDPLSTANKITEFLSLTSEVLSQRMHPIYSLLQTKFGLYGMPFERDLFDTFPPLLMKQANSMSNNSNVNGGHSHHHHNSTSSNGSNNLNTQHIGSSWSKYDCPNLLWSTPNNMKNTLGTMLSPLGGDNSDLGIILGQNGVTLGLTPQIGGLCGLFEVEPLHFSLHLASDGTKMERVFSGSNYSTIPYVVQPNSYIEPDLYIPMEGSKTTSVTTPMMQLNKAIEDMEHMVIKNHAVALLLSKKAKKSYLEKLKKAAKQKTSSKKISSSMHIASTSAAGTSNQNGQTNSQTSEGDCKATTTTSSTPSTLSSDTSPEGMPSSVIAKQTLGNSLPNDYLGNIVEDVANTIFSTSMLNSSISLLANVANDIPDPAMDSILPLDSQDLAAEKVIEIFDCMEEGNASKEDYDASMILAKLSAYMLQSDMMDEQNGPLSNGGLAPSSLDKGDKLIFSSLNKKFEENSKQEKLEKSLEELSSPTSGKTSTTSTTSTLTKEAKDSTASLEETGKNTFSSGGLPYQQLLSIPPQQMIVIERMHSGARRFVILDFGAPVVLTDVIIPACSDLVSLTIDIWLIGEETDGERLAVASDIGLRPLVLADLQPPPLCRYLKVTTLGRYGMVTAQCKIPVGAFYGHTVILPWYIQSLQSNVSITSKKMAKTQLSILSSMVEDVSCRYSLACSKLKSLLQPQCMFSNNGSKVSPSGIGGTSSVESYQAKKILVTYQECITEQHHLNLILSVMRRLQKFVGMPANEMVRTLGTGTSCSKSPNAANNSADYRKELENCSSDQLATIVQSLLNCLLTLSFPPPSKDVQLKLVSWCNPAQAKALIENVCIKGSKGAQVAVVSLLARLCTGQPWWGEFLATTLVSLFSSGESNEFPATRLFALLTFLGQKSVQCGRGTQVIDAVLQSLLSQLNRAGFPVQHQDNAFVQPWLFGGSQSQIDPILISWLLLFLSLCLDLVTNPKGSEDERNRGGGRWNWLTAESSLHKKSSVPSKETPRDSGDLLRKRLVHHKQKLVSLESATKSFDEVLTSLGSVINPKMFKQSEQVFKKIQKQHAMKHYKDLCSIQRNETNSLRRLSKNKSTNSNSKIKSGKEESGSCVHEIITPVNRICCLAVIRALIKLLLNTQHVFSVDTYLLTCKVIGGLVRITRPSLRVSEFLNEEQLVTLLTHSMTLDSMWGSPWAIHALTCLLQDVLEGERLFGAIVLEVNTKSEEKNVTDNNKGGNTNNTEVMVETAPVSDGGETSPLPTHLDEVGSTYDSFPITPTNEDASHPISSSTGESTDTSFTGEPLLINHQTLGESGGESDTKGATEKSSGDDTVVSKSTVSTSTANQSAIAVNPPTVNVATSHFAIIEEEESPCKYTFLESDDSSASDDMMEFLSDFQTDLNNLTVGNSSGFSNPMDSYNMTITQQKNSTKESRVSDLMTAQLSSQKCKMATDHSTAVDARLENGISLTSELRIHMMNAIHACRLRTSISAPLQVPSTNWREGDVYDSGNLKESVELLSRVFQNTLTQLSYKFEGNQLESVLEIWLNLNLCMCGGEYSSSVMPLIPLYPQSISALLAAVARSQSVSIRCWCLLLQILTLCSNVNHPEEATTGGNPPTINLQDHFNTNDICWMAQSIISDRNFILVLQKLLSGHYSTGEITRSDVVGSTLTSLLEDLLVRLEVRCDVISVDSVAGNNLKLTLLKLVMRLLETDAPFARGTGPLDIQRTLLTIMLSMHYNGLNKTHIPISIINSVAAIVNGYLCSNQEVLSGSAETNSSVLGGLLASVLGSDGQQSPIPTRRTILCALLNLAKKLVEIPLEFVKSDRRQANGSEGSHPSVCNYQDRYLTDSIKLEQKQMVLTSSGNVSQTDEHKALNSTGLASVSQGEEVLPDVNISRSTSDGSRGRSSNLNKECCHNQPNKVPCIADSVLQNHETMQMLLHSLKSSESNSAVPLNLIGMVSGDVSETLGIGRTLSDALYLLLLTLNQKATISDLLLSAILRYIRPETLFVQTNFSESLYCFFTQVLDCENLLKKFASMNGTKALWENLVKSVDSSGGPQIGLISSVMNHLSPPLPFSTMSSTALKRVDPTTGSPSSVESSIPKGLFNFAPLAAITSSSLTARPADALVKATQFFQRTKSPVWSYHFYPEENWVDLNLTLPCPILLHEVQIQPHTMGLGMCPAGISLETGIESGCLIPVTGLICTAGVTCIHVVLQYPIVASTVVVRFHRQIDQSTLGLTHLKLLGTTTFKNSLKGTNRDYTWEQGPQKSSYWWLRLVDHCMFDVPGGFNLMLESGSRVRGVMETMVTLLATSSIQSTNHPTTSSLENLTETLTNNNCQLIHTLSSTLIENTTLALVSYSQELLHGLLICLFNHPLIMQPAGSSAVEAAIALLCMVSTTNEGVKLLIDWFTKMVDHQTANTSPHLTESFNQRTVNPKILHCFSAIFWTLSEDVIALITDDLFRKIFDWCQKASGPVKEALDYIVCSLCKVQPHLFMRLMLFMGFLTVIDLNTTSITDDRKDREAEIRASCTDDMKESSDGCRLSGEGRLILQDPSVICITSHHLQTISFAAQSPSAIHLMLDSGFPLLLVHGILEWCKAELLHQVESCATPNVSESSTDIEKANVATLGAHSNGTAEVAHDGCQIPLQDALPPLNTGMVVHTLEALTAMCSEMTMKDWLGSGEGSVFWIPLLTVLGDPVMQGSEVSMRLGHGSNTSDYSRVEDATIQLMKVCCNNHDHNRKLLAGTLCHLIQRQNSPPPGGLTYLHSLSGFTRRLVLQILLETECVLVHVTSTFCLSQPPLHTLPSQTGHPRFGAGNKSRLMYLPITTKVEEVIRMVTDWWQQGTASQSSPLQNGEGGLNQDFDNGSGKKEISEVGLELVDKLSVAAGVLAKDKRMKDKGQIKARPKKSCQPRKNMTEKATGSVLSTYGLLHDSLLGGTTLLPEAMTLDQVLAAVSHNSSSQDLSQLKFNLVFAKDSCQEPSDNPHVQSLLKIEPRASILNVFTAHGGLSILAHHMALLYPDTSHQYVSSSSSKNGGDEKKEKTLDDETGFHIDTYYSMLPDYLSNNNVNNSSGISRGSALSYGVMPIPPHALGSFTLFLRLPGYAETLLTDRVKAYCLLRLALGVYDGLYDGENTSVVSSLATLPFQVLEILLRSTPLTTDDGMMLRKMCLSTGVLHLILACLSVLSHQGGSNVITALQHPNVPVGLLVASARGYCPSQKQSDVSNRSDNDRCHYWAKGTGFGTGSTNQSWNVEQALTKQKLEEQHVVWLIKLLAQYVNPGDALPEDLRKLCEEELKNLPSCIGDSTESVASSTNTPFTSLSFDGAPQEEESMPALPQEIFDLFLKAGLISKISSYLSNDSVLDISRHVPLYQALMALVRAIAVTPSLASIFYATAGTTSGTIGAAANTTASSSCQENEDSTNLNLNSNSAAKPKLPSLLTQMKKTVNTYINKLKWKAPTTDTRKSTEGKSSNEHKDLQTVPEEGESEDQGLSLLVPDIQLSTKIVEIVMERLSNNDAVEKKIIEPCGDDDKNATTTIVDLYLNTMKPLQFDSYEMIVEDPERGIRFVVPYHYESLVRDAGEVFNPKRMKRLAQEAVTLSTSLPLSYSSSVFVRTDMDRLDVMKVLITGPEDTPYANGCFEFDVYFTNFYPNSPLYINLQTTGEKRVRFNPNLYQDGKVCLSILNTWHGRPEEKWNPQTSSLLQVLVSIQSLILVPEPYFNEPGYERSRGSPAAMHNSQEYDANIKAATIRWAILNQMRNPSPCFKDVIEKHFWLKRKDIMVQVQNWVTELEEFSKSKRAGRVISHNAMVIKKLYNLLEEDFRKMVPPKGLEASASLLSSLGPSPGLSASNGKLKENEPSDDTAPGKHRVRKTSLVNIYGTQIPIFNEWTKKYSSFPYQCESPPLSWEDHSFHEANLSDESSFSETGTKPAYKIIDGLKINQQKEESIWEAEENELALSLGLQDELSSNNVTINSVNTTLTNLAMPVSPSVKVDNSGVADDKVDDISSSANGNTTEQSSALLSNIDSECFHFTTCETLEEETS